MLERWWDCKKQTNFWAVKQQNNNKHAKQQKHQAHRPAEAALERQSRVVAALLGRTRKLRGLKLPVLSGEESM